MLPQLMDYAGAFIYMRTRLSATNGGTTLVLDPSSWWIVLRIWGIGALALAGLAFGRRWPSWLRSSLLVTFLLASYGWGLDPLQSAIHRAILRSGYGDPPFLLALSIELGIMVGNGIVPGIVAAAALRDRFVRRTAIDASESIVLVMAATIFVLGQATDLCESTNGKLPPLSDLPILALVLVLPWISLAIGWVIVKAIGPAWSRWFGLGYDGCGSEANHSEA